MHGTVCVYAQPLRSGMSQGDDTGRTASSSSFLLKKEPMVLRELVRLGPASSRMASFLVLVQKELVFVPGSEAFNSFVGYGFLIPELKGGSEVSEDEQADNGSNEASNVIGLHGSGDKISRYLQDWEVAKVALEFFRS